MTVFADLFGRALDTCTGIIGASALYGVTLLIFAADDLCTRIRLTLSLVTELLWSTSSIFAGIIHTSAIFAAFTAVARDIRAGFYTVAITTETSVWTGFVEARIGFAFALAATFAVFATFAVAVLFDANSCFTNEVCGAIDLFASIDALTALTGGSSGALDTSAGIVCAFAFCIAHLAVCASDIFAGIVFALADDTDLASCTLRGDARISFACAVDAALCGCALDVCTRGDTFSIAAKSARIARNRFARIGFTGAISAAFAFFAAEIVAIVFDAFSIFADFSGITADAFAEIFAEAIFATKTARTAYEFAWIFGTSAIDANATGRASHAFAWIADALANKADFARFARNSRTRVFFALAVVAGFARSTGRSARSDTLAFGAGGSCGALDASAGIVDALTAYADLVAWASKRVTIGCDALPFPTSESSGTLEDVACVEAHAALAGLAVFASDIGTRDLGNTESVFALFANRTFSIATSVGALAVDASRAAWALCAFVDFSVTVVVDTVTDLGFGLTGKTGAFFAAFALLNACAASGGTRADQVFVDKSVAIVVFAVADLRSGFEGSYTKLPIAVDALLFSSIAKGLTGAFFAFFALCSAVVVDLAVAIVICVVAAKLFFCGFAFTDTSAPDAVCTGLLACFTRADAFCSSGAAVAGASVFVVAFAVFVFVDLAVAVVVFAIADFGGGFGSRAFAPCAVGAIFKAIATGGFAGTADAFVDATVAVVVLAIAGFGLGEDLACASAPCAVGAALRSCFAIAFSCGSSGATVTGFGFTFFAKARTSFVYLSVAIVIELVSAQLGAGLTCATIRPFSAATGFGSTAASSTTGLCEIFVDLSVAVVVESIADLDARQDLSGAVAPVSGGASLFAVFADPSARCTRRASIAGSLLPIGTGCSTTFVCAAIAVVVDVVSASLGGCGSSCLYGADGGGFGGVADLDTCTQTSAHTDGARLSEIRKGFVDTPIAVVVGVVANFGTWGDFANASAIHPVGAASCAALASADALCSSRARITGLCEAFVDLAVTVVVYAIADFGADLFGDIFEGLDKCSSGGCEITFGGAARDGVAVEFGLANGVPKSNRKGLYIVGLCADLKSA